MAAKRLYIRLSHWLRAHDPGLRALRRAGRAAIVMPAMFALGDRVIGNPALATFAAFGSFAMVLLVDFAGPMRDRLQAQAALSSSSVACLLYSATLASNSIALARSDGGRRLCRSLRRRRQLGSRGRPPPRCCFGFILSVSLAGPGSSIPDRLAGWGLASGASMLAIGLLWPAPTREPLRDGAIKACRALAMRLRTNGAGVRAGGRAGRQQPTTPRSPAPMPRPPSSRRGSSRRRTARRD